MSSSDTVQAYRDWKELIESDGWKRLVEIADEQIAGRVNEIVLKPMTDLAHQEFAKGEVAGIKLFIAIPETQKTMFEAQFDRETDEEEENERADS